MELSLAALSIFTGVKQSYDGSIFSATKKNIAALAMGRHERNPHDKNAPLREDKQVLYNTCTYTIQKSD